ncbi:MAG: 5-formyltetrahydrofolate cyclo-ligase [Bacteriovoracia bacterium]
MAKQVSRRSRTVKSKAKSKASPKSKATKPVFTGPRAVLLARRAELTPEWVADKSWQACERVRKVLAKFWPELTVATFRPMAQEAQVGLLDPWFRSAHARLCFPRLIDHKGNMQLAEVKSDSHWRFNSYGIQEPSTAAEVVSPKQVDVILVPCVGVTAKGHRVGMGKGYYDRLLKNMPEALKIVVAFDFQVVSKLPQAKWDQAVDWVITERREIRTPRVGAWLKRRRLSLG